jgi:glycerol kinase
MPYVLALDQGTTSSRAIVFDHDGAMVALAQRELTQHFPRPGWVEHDPEEIWLSQHGVALEALAKAGLAAPDIVAIGIANQRETTLAWERDTGRPVHNAIVWQDRRTAQACEQLKTAGHEETVRRKTGLIIDPYFSATKLAWLLDNVEGARRTAEEGRLAFGTVDAWLLYKLTGRHTTDVTNASRTMLFDIHGGAWDDELLGLLNIPRSVLPEVGPSSGVYGDAAVEGLEGVPVTGVAGDQQAALFGQTCFDAGMAKNTYGTGCFALLNTGAQPAASQHGLISTIAWQVGDGMDYALEGSVFSAGATVQWLRDGLGIIASAAEVEGLAASVADNGGVYLVPAFAGLGAPHWDPHARGTIVGLTRDTTAGHIARAALEGVAYQVADILEVMQADTGIAMPELRVDGGASANDLLMQFQADILGVPVTRPKVTETTALGAAYLAGLATGFWDSKEAIARHAAIDRRFEPSMPREQALSLRSRWQQALERSLGWANDAGQA